MSDVRTRFAPSPTGWLHVGGMRTALFAWLIAKQAKGQFILRIEDTDQARQVSGAEEHIMDSLKWLGLDWDEGPDKEGSYGPYRQSERLDIYKQWAQKLIDINRAYADPFTPQQLEEFRQQAKSQKKAFLFRDHRPEQPPKWNGEMPLRFKSEPKPYHWQDLVMGKLSSGPEVIDDFIILKSDGFPTYNFAHIIDDHLMKISHVVRSQEFIASVPRYLNLYEALSLSTPILATLPFVLALDGTKKLGKRDGAKDILDYRKQGYLADALFNFLITLGWNDGTTQEIFSRTEILSKFDINRVQRSGAKFDEYRLTWMNGHYIRQMQIDDLAEAVKDYWPSDANSFDTDYKRSVLGLVQERLKFFDELSKLTDFFFSDLPIDTGIIKSHKQLSKLPSDQLHQLLQNSRDELAKSNFKVDDLTTILNQLLEQTKQTPAILFSLIRIVTTWSPASPPLAESLSVLGKNVTMRRLDLALRNI